MVSIKFRQKIDLRYYKLVYRVGKKLNKKDKDITKRLINRPVLSIASDEFADTFSQYVKNQKPMLLARLGGTEGNVAGEYCEKRLGLRRAYSDTVINWFYTTSGFFADDYANKEQAMDQYAELTLEGIKECDFLSAFFPTRVYMPFFFKYYTQNAVATYSDSGPCFDKPTDKHWIRELKGKRVLIINNFTESIEYQWNRKSLLVKSKEYELPDFELLLYRTYVTQVGERPGGFTNFFQVLEKMKSDISKIEFDIALIGAGAYGFPLAVEVKKMGKIAMETCSHTPIFFGIYGERDLKYGCEKYMTDAWIRPLEEPPKRYKEVENGCYW